MSDIVERLREEAASKERIAWNRTDGGQDATLAGMLADQAADEIERLRGLLGDILAVIHRDGGHHTEAVGLEQSVADAHLVWAKLQERGDE